MISATNPPRNAMVALLGAIVLHLVLIAAAAVWLAPSIDSARSRQRDPVLMVALQRAAASATATAVSTPSLPTPAKISKPSPLQQQKMPPRLAAAKRAPRKPAVHALDQARPPIAAPQPQTIVLPVPSATPSRAPGITPNTTSSYPSDAAPQAVPEAAPVAASTGVTISAAYAARNRKPDYPLMSRRYNEQGTVVLRVLVTAGGTAGEVRIGKSSGYPLLDQSALTAVRDWRFVAATRDGKPVSEWYQIPIPYTLQD